MPLKARPLRTRPHHLFGLTYELTQREREHDPAVIVAWGARAILAAAMMTKRRRPPLLAVHHDLYPKPAIRGAVRAGTRRADATAAASQAIAAQLPGDVVVIHPGVDLAAFTPSPLPPGPPQRARGRRARRLEAPGPRAPDRRTDARAARHLRRRAAARRDVRHRRPRENVTFAGRVEDIRDALAQAHVLLHCADAEPFGLALVEALAAGRPVVAPDAAGPQEIVTGPEGRLYPPGDADAAVEALEAVLADDRGARGGTQREPRRSTSTTPCAACGTSSTPRSSAAATAARRETRRSHGAVSFAAVIVTHRSRAELAHAARELQRRRS